jgi:hypothetical protein
MARTAFHRKLGALTGSSSGDMQLIVKTINDGNRDLKSTLVQHVDDVVGQRIDAVDLHLKTHVEKILGAIDSHRLPDLFLTEAARDVLSGLAQVEVMTLDKTPAIAESNHVLKKQAAGRRMAARKSALAGSPDTALAADYAAVFRDFETGDEAERAARLMAVMSLRERVLRHFAEQHAADNRK